jgi:probable F420-dependent oxidoreductase
MNIGRLGVWAIVNFAGAAESAGFARRVEQWGYGAIWVPEVTAREPLVTCSWLLANTTSLNLATGIASIYSRDCFVAVNAQYALAEQSGGRFLLGLGVSHAPFVEGVLGHTFEKPALAMKRFLEGMANMKYLAPQPAEKPKTVIGALGPRMLEVAGAHADGAHTYNITPEHTAEARRVLGPGKLLCPEQMVLLERDPAAARAIGRKALALSFTLPNYRSNYLRLGFAAEDLENGGSDRLIDALVAWGDEQAIRSRIQQHWDAGADHVCIQPLRRGTMTLTADDQKILELLAPAHKSISD